eukprot:1679863-Rhodomonas_salina.1
MNAGGEILSEIVARLEDRLRIPERVSMQLLDELRLEPGAPYILDPLLTVSGGNRGRRRQNVIRK